jgi:preprotein translocase subunit SecD
MALAACSESATPSRTPTPRAHVAPQPFNVGTAVDGAPDPHDAAFLRDQENLYDASQFGDPQFYQTGYHWKIDPRIGPHGITNTHVAYDSASGQWAIVISFTPSAAQEWAAVTTAAYNAGVSSPLNRIAIFAGNRVVSAPNVQSPSSSTTEITGNFTQQQAQELAAAIQSAA